MVMVNMQVLGGPDDGGVIQMPLEGAFPFMTKGPTLVWPAKDGEEPRTGLKTYHYFSDPQKRVVRYQGEVVHMHEEPGEEVSKMSFKKHGTGQVIETEAEKGDLSKTASQQDWKPSDEQALEEED